MPTSHVCHRRKPRSDPKVWTISSWVTSGMNQWLASCLQSLRRATRPWGVHPPQGPFWHSCQICLATGWPAHAGTIQSQFADVRPKNIGPRSLRRPRGPCGPEHLTREAMCPGHSRCRSVCSTPDFSPLERRARRHGTAASQRFDCACRLRHCPCRSDCRNYHDRSHGNDLAHIVLHPWIDFAFRL